MTACNLIVQPDAAYLLTDTACYTPGGVILGFQPKVVTLTSLIVEPTAIALTGNVFPQDIAPAIERAAPASTAQLLAILPDLVREAERTIAHRMAAGQRPSVALLIASFDTRRMRARGWAIANDLDGIFDRGSGYQPFTVRGIEWKANVDHVGAFGGVRQLNDPAQFDPVVDGARLLQQQRREVQDGQSIVGGEGTLTRVSLEGISARALCQWPDEVGQAIG